MTHRIGDTEIKEVDPLTGQVIKKTRPIQPVEVDGFKLEPDVMFTNHKGVPKKSIEKRQVKLLEKISFLEPFLKEGEKIRRITSACSPMSFLEQYLGGWIIFSQKRCLLIFTNKRIFHVPTTPNLAYRNSIAEIWYEDCQLLKQKGHTLSVKYNNGKKEQFFYVKGNERKKIKFMLSEATASDQPNPQGRRNHLCPKCMSILIDGIFTCENCQMEFKNKARAKKLSMIYPGGGYFYTGHPVLGVLDAIAETYILLLMIMAAFNVIKGYEGAVGGFGVTLLLFAIEKAVTVYHSNHYLKEFIPAEKDFQADNEAS